MSDRDLLIVRTTRARAEALRDALEVDLLDDSPEAALIKAAVADADQALAGLYPPGALDRVDASPEEFDELAAAVEAPPWYAARWAHMFRQAAAALRELGRRQAADRAEQIRRFGTAAVATDRAEEGDRS
jgi:hypothetical protein